MLTILRLGSASWWLLLATVVILAPTSAASQSTDTGGTPDVPRLVAPIGHVNGGIHALAFSGDGGFIATAGNDNTARVWDTASKLELLTLPHPSAVNAIAFTPDGASVVTGDFDGILHVWNSSTGKERFHRSHGGSISAVAIAPDGATIATGGDNGIRLWQASDGKPRQAGNDNLSSMSAKSLAFSHNGELLAVGGFGNFAVWSVARHVVLPGFTYSDIVWSVAFSANDDRIITGGNDHTVRVWSTSSGKELKRLNAAANVWSVAISRDGTMIAAASEGGLQTWDAAASWRERTLIGRTAVGSVSFSPDGQRLVEGESSPEFWGVRTGVREPKPVAVIPDPLGLIVASANGRDVLMIATSGRAALWDTVSGRQIAQLKNLASQPEAAAFTRDGRTLAYISAAQREVTLWSTETAALLRVFRAPLSRTEAITENRNGTILATGEADGHIRIWNRALGALAADLASHAVPIAADAISAIAISPDDTMVASGGGDGMVYVQPLSGGKPALSLRHRFPVTAVAYSPDGKLLVTAEISEGGATSAVHFRDSRTGADLHAVEGGDSVVFSRDGKLLYTDRGGTLFVYDARTGRRLHQSDSEGGPLALSSDGRLLLTGGFGDGIGHIRDLAGHLISTLKGHRNPIKSVAFSPDGKLAFTASYDDTVRCWDVRSGHEVGRADVFRVAALVQGAAASEVVAAGDVVPHIFDMASRTERHPFVKHQATIEGLALSADGRSFLTFGENQDAFVWDAKTGQELRRLKGSSRGVETIAFSPDGRFATAGDYDGFLLVWRVADGRLIAKTRAHRYGVNAVVWSPTGRIISADSISHSIRIWDQSLHSSLSPIDARQSVENLTLSVDGTRLLANGGVGGRIINGDGRDGIVYDVLTGRELTRVRPLGADVYSSTIVGQGNIIATGHNDGTVDLWNWPTRQLLCTFLNLSTGVSVVYAPDGRFDVSSFDVPLGLHWVIPDAPSHPLPLEIYTRTYFTPNLLKGALSGVAPFQLASISTLNRALPVVLVDHVTPSAAGDTVTVDVRVTNAESASQLGSDGRPRQSGAYDVRLYRDEQLVAQSPNEDDGAFGSDDPSDLTSWRQRHDSHLSAGGSRVFSFPGIRVSRGPGTSHRFTAYAFNADRVKGLTSPGVDYRRASALPGNRRRAYLITMGVDANQSHWYLEFAVSSAHDVAALLQERLRGRYDDVVPVALDSEFGADGVTLATSTATKNNLRAVFDVLAGRDNAVDPHMRQQIDPQRVLRAATPDDAVLLYVSSHGYVDPAGHFYSVPYDTAVPWGITEEKLTRCAGPGQGAPECAQAMTFLSHAISSQDLGSWWRNVDGGELTMILDTCFAASAPGVGFRPGPLGDRTFGQLSYDKRIRVLSAAQRDKSAHALWIGANGRTVLADTLDLVARRAVSTTLADLLRQTTRELPVRMRTLYPDLPGADVQIPELLDFERTKTAAPAGGSQ